MPRGAQLSLLALLSMLAASSLAAGSPHVYYPASLGLAPQRPELVLAQPPGGGVEAALGDAGASASVMVYISRRAQLVYNPDLYSSPDGWYCVPSDSLLCHWLPSDSGAAGGVVAIANFTGLVAREAAFAVQEVAVPESRVVNASINVTVRGEWALHPIYYLVGIIDAENSTWVWGAGGVPPTSYETLAWDVTPYIEPGRRYLLAVGALVVLSLQPALYVDSVYFTVETEYYTASQPILAADLEGGRVLYVRLRLESLNAGGVNASIWLVNSTGAESAVIAIVDGSPRSRETGWIEVGAPPPGYSALLLRLNVASKAATAGLDLTLEYCTLPDGMGACVSYPLRVAVTPNRR